MQWGMRGKTERTTYSAILGARLYTLVGLIIGSESSILGGARLSTSPSSLMPPAIIGTGDLCPEEASISTACPIGISVESWIGKGGGGLELLRAAS